ncbi:MAG: tetratricopeptide repeat protein [Bacteroidetes bacterium]|nr:tetratricopeptide repeat protein [Bacteroidota bacterium]
MAKKTEDVLDINESINKAETFIENNKKSLIIIVIAIVVVLAGYLAYTNFWLKPQELKAQSAIFPAQFHFKNDSTDLAINGKGTTMGFKQIAAEYGSTKSGNLAHYYLGMCYMKKGQWQEAIDALMDYDAEDDVTGALALGAIGDAYSELGNKDEALNYYKKATAWDNNSFTAPYFLKKQGFAFESKGDFKSAVDVYTKIQTGYSKSDEARDIEKYITRANAKAGN